MRVTVVHNRYRSSQPSGENDVVEDEIRQLTRAGVDVDRWVSSSDVLFSSNRFTNAARQARMAAAPLVGTQLTSELARHLSANPPDVVHVHNLFPLFSPQVVRIAHDLGIPVVQTLHNFRRECVKGTFEREGSICRQCDGAAVPIAAVRHGCYQDSRARSLPMAAAQVTHRSTWQLVSRHLALTEFQAEWLEDRGIPRRRIVVRPTSCEDDVHGPPVAGRLCFVGRLDEVKGIDLLLEEWERSPLPAAGWMLDIVGDGPLLEPLRARHGTDHSLFFHGRQRPAQVHSFIDRAAAIVVPSRCFEGYPRVIAESFCRERPVVVIDNANLSSIVSDRGWVAPGPQELRYVLGELRSVNELRARGRKARAEFEARLHPDAATSKLLSVYRDAIAEIKPG